MEAVEDYLENCANMKVDIEVLERLMEPEDLDLSKVHPEVLDKRRQQFFQLFDTSEKRVSWQTDKDWRVKEENGAQQESGQKRFFFKRLRRKSQSHI